MKASEPSSQTLLSHRRVTVDPEVLSESIGDEVVLVHMGTDCIYELNHTAGFVWTLLRDGCTRDEIVRQVREQFTVDEDRFRHELEDFIRALTRDRLLAG